MTLSDETPTQTNAAKWALVSQIIFAILGQKTFSGTSLNKLKTCLSLLESIGKKT